MLQNGVVSEHFAVYTVSGEMIENIETHSKSFHRGYNKRITGIVYDPGKYEFQTSPQLFKSPDVHFCCLKY